jgi:transposase, IS6 family
VTNGSKCVNETCIRVKGEGVYLYRAVDAARRTIDILVSAKRHVAVAGRFFRKALGQPHTIDPRMITVDKMPLIQSR